MKLAIVYFSKTGNTRQMAEHIAQGARGVDGVQAEIFTLEEIDKAYLKESQCVIFGAPTYVADVAGGMKSWFDGPGTALGLAGKMAGAFATSGYEYGGGELAVQSMLNYCLVYGMYAYSGGASFGKPVIHLGPVACHDNLPASEELFVLYGKRMATAAKRLFGG
ncbi:NAD(P)H-dependent oxidoreductase [Ruminococcaceae bacterium OttesenSCG-928-O06]|nr:NAD(P)H-dependent oxidoreductase [Ruminococcaceae bacterium OttesenSCG-928-O06]